MRLRPRWRSLRNYRTGRLESLAHPETVETCGLVHLKKGQGRKVAPQGRMTAWSRRCHGSVASCDPLVADRLESRLLQPKRLGTVLASVIDRRRERTERQRENGGF